MDNMNTIVENLSILESIKHDIGNAIVSKGGSVTDAFGGYAKAILDLPTGGGGDTSIEDGLIQRTLSGEYSNSRIMAVGRYAFYGCSNLISVNLPNCTSLFDYAFQNCKSIKYVNIPKCSMIGYYALNSSPIEYINVPQKVVFSAYALSSASSLNFEEFPSMAVLTSLNAVHDNIRSKFSSANFAYSIPSATTTTLISGDWYGVANGITRSNKNLVEVNLPNAWYIDRLAFSNCTNLATVNIPEAMFLGDSAFYNCKITNINAEKVLYIGNNCFVGGSFDTIDLHNCKYIEDYGFYKCSLLQSINIPMCSYIGDGAFANNTNLQSIDLPLCSYIGNDTFNNCHSLSYVSPLYKCKYIGVNGFNACSSLKYLYLPDCSSIYSSAFFGCRKFSTIILLSDSVCNLYNNLVFNLTPINSEGTGSIFVPSSLVTDYQTHSVWSRFSEKIQPFELKNSGRIANDNIPLSIPESIFIKKSELGESKWTWWAGSQESGTDIMLDIWYEDGKLKYDCHVNVEEVQVPAIVNIETFYGEDYIHIMFDLSGFTTYEISEDDYITVTRPVDFYTL